MGKKNKEDKLYRIISEQIKKVLKETKEQYSQNNFVVKEYTPNSSEWEYIKENKLKLWDFLNNGYIHAGYEKFCGCDNYRSLLKNANLIKIAFQNNEWVAVSVYTGYRGGFKNVGITATVDSDSRDCGVGAVHDIIKTDIGNFENFFWTECSGSVEKLYDKYNGIKIPNEYAFGILQTPVTLDNDGFHYTREIKGDIQRKIIYGFNNKETFEKVLNERREYINNCINSILSNNINEDVEKPSFGRLSKLDCAIAVVNFFVDQRWEGECYEFPQENLMALKQQIKIINIALKNNLVPEDKKEIAEMALENGMDILKTSSVMKVYSL